VGGCGIRPGLTIEGEPMKRAAAVAVALVVDSVNEYALSECGIDLEGSDG
jgi:hypothetical protein